MNQTKAKEHRNEKILVDTLGLQEMLSSGRQSAVSIGIEARAKVQVGRRVFWNTKKIQKYLDAISE